MDKKIKKYLKKLDKDSDLDFKALIKLIKDNDIPIKDCGLRGPAGIAMHDKILIDILTLDSGSYSMTFFIILHEIGHYLRLQKLDKNYVINLYKSDDFKLFFDDMIDEELFADKFANIYYYKLNGKSINFYQFMRDDKNKIDSYANKIKPLFYSVNSKKDYKRLFKSLTYKRNKKEFEGVL